MWLALDQPGDAVLEHRAIGVVVIGRINGCHVVGHVVNVHPYVAGRIAANAGEPVGVGIADAIGEERATAAGIGIQPRVIVGVIVVIREAQHRWSVGSHVRPGHRGLIGFARVKAAVAVGVIQRAAEDERVPRRGLREAGPAVGGLGIELVLAFGELHRRRLIGGAIGVNRIGSRIGHHVENHVGVLPGSVVAVYVNTQPDQRRRIVLLVNVGYIECKAGCRGAVGTAGGTARAEAEICEIGRRILADLRSLEIVTERVTDRLALDFDIRVIGKQPASPVVGELEVVAVGAGPQLDVCGRIEDELGPVAVVGVGGVGLHHCALEPSFQHEAIAGGHAHRDVGCQGDDVAGVAGDGESGAGGGSRLQRELQAGQFIVGV